MTVSSLATEAAKLATAQEAGIADLGVRDRVLCKLANDAISAKTLSEFTLVEGKILIGSAGDTATAVTPTGIIDISATGVVSFDTAYGSTFTTSTNGEISVAGMTTNGAVVLTAMESVAAVHAIPTANKITVYEAGTTNVISAKKFGLLVIKL